MGTIIRRHPYVIVGLVTLVLSASLAGLGITPDAGGGALALFLLVYALGWPFWLAAAAASAFLGDSALAPALWMPLGLAPYAVADWRLRERRRAHIRERAA